MNRDGCTPNDQGITWAEVKQQYIADIMKNGLAKTKKQAENLLIEAMFRSIVGNELMTMVYYLADPEGYDQNPDKYK